MASIYDLKPGFQGLLRPLTRALARGGFTANQVTLAACALSLLTAASVALRPDDRRTLFVVPVLLFVRMALNAIDGMLAREHGMKSRLGGILNELTDVISDAALYLAFAYVPGVRPEWAVAVAVLGIVSEMAGVVSVTIGGTRRYDGPMGKSDRAFAFGLLAILLGCGVQAGTWVDAYFAALVLMLCLTVFNRCSRALAEAK